MKNWVASKTLLCICGLAIAIPVSASAADWEVEQPKGYYNKGYGDFPPSDIEQRQFQDLPRDEKIANKAAREKQVATSTQSSQAASSQAQTSQQQAAAPTTATQGTNTAAQQQTTANTTYNPYGTYYPGYQYPAGGYYGYGYPGYGYGYRPHRKKHKGFNFSGSPFDWDDDGPFNFGSNSWDRPWGNRSWGRDRGWSRPFGRDRDRYRRPYDRPYDRDNSGFSFGNNHKGDSFNWGW